MDIPYAFKKCSKCGEWLVASEINFNKRKYGKYGLYSECKKCRTKQHKQYYKDNKDKIAEQHKQYREDNKDKIKQYYKDNKDKKSKQQKQYRKNNKDKIAERHKQYYSTPQGQVVTFNSNYRRRIKEQNQGDGINKDQWLEMMEYFGFRCAYSGKYIGGKENQNIRSIDHIKPLNKGGKHEVWNCVPMDRGLNSSKKDKDMEEWYQKQDFYSEERLQKIYEWQEYAYNKYSKK